MDHETDKNLLTEIARTPGAETVYFQLLQLKDAMDQELGETWNVLVRNEIDFKAALALGVLLGLVSGTVIGITQAEILRMFLNPEFERFLTELQIIMIISSIIETTITGITTGIFIWSKSKSTHRHAFEKLAFLKQERFSQHIQEQVDKVNPRRSLSSIPNLHESAWKIER